MRCQKHAVAAPTAQQVPEREVTLFRSSFTCRTGMPVPWPRLAVLPVRIAATSERPSMASRGVFVSWRATFAARHRTAPAWRGSVPSGGDGILFARSGDGPAWGSAGGVCRHMTGELKMAHDDHLACIEACHACAVACDHCAVSCLQEPDPRLMARCIALDMDCAQLCRLALSFMARGSAHDSAICAVCADVCLACAQECARHDMAHCKACAEACRTCAEECRRLSAPPPDTETVTGTHAVGSHGA